jgi:hypothetical protein
MKAQIIFPETAWTESSLGFAGIRALQRRLEEATSVKVTREYQAVVFDIDGLVSEQLALIREALPDGYEIPALVDGTYMVLSRNRESLCLPTDSDYARLLRDAHLVFGEGEPASPEGPRSVSEIDRMCAVFADIEAIPWYTPFNVESLLTAIPISGTMTRKLAGVLVDIKATWLGLEYDLLQMSRNTTPAISLGQGVRVYGVPALRGTAEEQEAARRFRRYVYVSNAVVRIRTLWEKLIALGVLLERPGKLDAILGRKRVRTAFVKSFADAEHPVTKLIWDHVHSLDVFEARFRTPELHKTGRAIWWTTAERLGEETNRLLGHRNDLNRLLQKVVQALEPAESTAGSEAPPANLGLNPTPATT